MEWVWKLLEKFVVADLDRSGIQNPSDTELENAFVTLLSETTVTVLVQEPWRNSVRFKCLAKFHSEEMFDLLNRPESFLRENYGGGKFKLNFHRGWHFVATQNFKPDGDPVWKSLPEIEM